MDGKACKGGTDVLLPNLQVVRSFIYSALTELSCGKWIEKNIFKAAANPPLRNLWWCQMPKIYASTPRRLAVVDLRRCPLQVEIIFCNFFVSLTELQSGFLKTPWVLLTLTQNHTTHSKEIKYVWLPGMKALVKILLIKHFSSPFSYLAGFTSKEHSQSYCWGCMVCERGGFQEGLFC